MRPELARIRDFVSKARRYETLAAEQPHEDTPRARLFRENHKALSAACDRAVHIIGGELAKIEAMEAELGELKYQAALDDISASELPDETKQHLLKRRAAKHQGRG